jgi:hypothetical protein
MTCTRVTINVHGGITHFCCPRTGVPIVDDQGFNEDKQSPHVRFVIDYIGGVWMTPRKRTPADQIAYMERCAKLLFDEDRSTDSLLRALARVLPPSVVIFELTEPARGGGHDGSWLLVAIEMGEVISAARTALGDGSDWLPED